jgi:hypothetical protein
LNNGVQTCTSAGQWGGAVSCTNQACVNGACQGVCTPNAVSCFDADTPRKCNATGAWVNQTDCTLGTPVCLNGGCVECTPNVNPTSCASTCSKQPQYCSLAGAWTNYTPICTGANSCIAGSCGLAADEPVGANTPAYTESANGVQDFVLAQKIQINCRSYILKLGQLFATSAGQARFALYTDSGGLPGSLVAATGAVTVAATTEATSSVYLADPGTYWVVTNVSSGTAAMSLTSTGGSARYAAYAFSNPAFPATFPASSPIANTYNLYAVVRRNPP